MRRCFYAADRAACLPDIEQSSCTYKLTSGCDCMHKTCTRENQSPSVERGGGRKISPPAEELYTPDSCLAGRVCFPGTGLWSSSSCPSRWPHARTHTDSTRGVHGLAVCSQRELTNSRRRVGNIWLRSGIEVDSIDPLYAWMGFSVSPALSLGERVKITESFWRLMGF